MLAIYSEDIETHKTPALVIPVCQDRRIHSRKSITALLRRAEHLEEFKGRPEDAVTFYAPEGVSAERVILMGVGKYAELTTESFRAMAGKAVGRCLSGGLENLLMVAPDAAKTGLDPVDTAEALLEGAFLANHPFDDYKKDKDRRPLSAIGLFVDGKSANAMESLPEKVRLICGGTVLARRWVSMPSNDKTPPALANAIAERGEKEGLKVTVMDEKELAANGFGAIMAVGAGSDNPSRLVVLDLNPEKAKRTVALVGKGVTYDSGGLNLKTGEGMRNMKSDMAGAAAVAAALLTLARRPPAMRVVGVMPLVENMPSGRATRPGDIIRTYSGKTVEIGNTDAEGRLILADALAWTIDQYRPEIVVDLATLTGACVIALGEKLSAVFSDDDALAAAIVEAGAHVHERCWRMPMPADYKEMIKSDFADIGNMPSARWGGAITAALFLSEFVDREKTRWAHIDIAGPAYNSKAGAYCGPGGSGFGARLLCDLLERI